LGLDGVTLLRRDSRDGLAAVSHDGPRDRSLPESDSSARRAGYDSCTRETFQVPSRIDGGFSSGQYIRSMRMKRPAGAGSQFDSFAFPGDSCWMRRSTEPSGLAFKWSRSLTEYRWIGFGTKK